MKRIRLDKYPMITILVAVLMLSTVLESNQIQTNSLETSQGLSEKLYTESSYELPKAYVSDAYASNVSVIDLTTNLVIKNIPIYTPSGLGFPSLNDIKAIGGKVFLSVPGTNLDPVDQIKVINCTSDTVTNTLPSNRTPSGFAMYDGRLFLLNKVDKTIFEIDPKSETVIRSIPFTIPPNRSEGHINLPLFLEVQDDKIYLPFPGTGTDPGAISILNLTDGSLITSFDTPQDQPPSAYGPYSTKTISENKTYLGMYSQVFVLDRRNYNITKQIPIGYGEALAMTSASGKIYVALSKSMVAVIDPQTDNLLKTIDVGLHAGSSHATDIAAFGNRVYVTDASAQNVKVIDSLTDTVVNTINTGQTSLAIDFNVESNIVVTYPSNGQTVNKPCQNITGHVLNPSISEIAYAVRSLIHEHNGTAPVLGSNFTFCINLTEGYNILTISEQITEKTLILTLDTSAPLVTFVAGSYFNWLNLSTVFLDGTQELPEPAADYDGWKDRVQHYGQDTLSWGLLKSRDRDFFKNGKKVRDEHTEWEYYEFGPAKGLPKKKTTTYTDENGVVQAAFGTETIEYEYDQNGKLTKEVRTTSGTGGQATVKETTTYKYGPDGRLTEKTVIKVDVDAGKTISKQVFTGYEYDAQGRPTKYKDASDPITIEIEYDAQGRVKKITVTVFGIVTTTTYEYDSEGRLIKEVVEQKDLQNPGAEFEKTTKTYEYSDEKVKVTTTKNPIVRTVQVSEHLYQSNFPTFNESITFPGKILVGDTGSDPMISPSGPMLIMISIVNATGNYTAAFLGVGNFFDFNMTLSTPTTLTIMVMDEAGNIGIKTVHVPKLWITDVNGDHKVNMIDVGRAARAFMTYPGHPRWDFFADINNDGKIDMKDIGTVARDFGKSY